MRKRVITLVSLVLMCIIALSNMPLISGNFVSAYHVGAANFLPNVAYYPPAGFDTAYELSLSIATAQYITSELSKWYNPWPNHCYDYYESDCTVNNYKLILNALDLYDDEVVIFSKGHRTIQKVNGENHYGLIAWNGQYLLDYNIHTYTSSKNVVTFIWHCQTAQHYNGNGQVPLDNNNVPYGLPYCFTHNANMQKYGFSGTQVYLGWEDNSRNYTIYWTNGTISHTGLGQPAPYNTTYIGSPQYEWLINPDYKYAQVAGNYWYYMQQGCTTNQALNKLSNDIYGTRFDDTELKNWLIVYGNMNVGLPY